VSTGTKLQRGFKTEATIEASKPARRDGTALNRTKFKYSPSILQKLEITQTIGTLQMPRGLGIEQRIGLSFLWVRKLTKRFLI